VTLKGLALQNGALGDIITVRNPESLKVIPALVVGENRVEVRL
jgi:flagella basal body P-ring formation protein FlgA